ncbi:hypothetical protein ABZ689_30945, partial [Streptomyces sp. NPDC006874]|uniref:hypothetical protein n=1 Tax=Streptomyces sp. NPDC006874 TaxID=3157189 RepID=UPI00340137D7
ITAPAPFVTNEIFTYAKENKLRLFPVRAGRPRARAGGAGLAEHRTEGPCREHLYAHRTDGRDGGAAQ